MVRISKCCGTTLTSSLVLDLPLMIGYPHSRVSNETGQYNFLGQTDRSSFIVKGQRKTSSKSYHGTGRARTVYQNTGRDTGRNNHYFSVKIRDGTGTGRDNCYFFPMISCFITSLPVSEHTFLVLEPPFPVFGFLGLLILSRDVRDRGICPRIFELALVPGERDSGTRIFLLSQDKGTMGPPVLECPGMSRPLESLP